MSTRSEIKELKEHGCVLWNSVEKSNTASEKSVKKKIKKFLKRFNGSLWYLIRDDDTVKYISPFSIAKTVLMIDVSRIVDLKISRISLDRLPINAVDTWLEFKLLRNDKDLCSANLGIFKSDPRLNTLADLLNEYGRSDLAIKIRSF